MLVFCDEKRSTKPLTKLVEGVQNFLEFCTPASRIPAAIEMGRPDWRNPDPRQQKPFWSERWHHDLFGDLVSPPLTSHHVQHLASATTMTSLLPQALARSNEEDTEVTIRWCPVVPGSNKGTIPPGRAVPFMEPFIGKDPIDMHPVFLTLGQAKANPEPRTVWIIVSIATGFEAVDAEFLDFVRIADATLPFKLAPAKWRSLTRGPHGKRVSKKIFWPESSG